MLRVHRSALWLPGIFRQIRRLGRSCRKVSIVILADRPSALVTLAIEKEQWSAKYNVIVEPSPVQVVGTSQNWAASLQFLHDRLVQERPDAILNLDDDQWFTDQGLQEISGHLQFFTEDRYEYESLFAWDDPEHYNARFPRHMSGNLFRVYRGDRWATHFVAHCPEACARSDQVTILKSPAINFGYMDADVRADYWIRYKRAGKIDAHTLALIREPDLRKMPAFGERMQKLLQKTMGERKSRQS